MRSKHFRLLPGYIFVGLSVLHTVVGLYRFNGLSEYALWFFSAGMALFFVGALNVILQHNRGSSLARTFVIVSNLMMTTFVMVFGFYTMKRNLGNPLAWLLILNAVTALTISLKTRQEVGHGIDRQGFT